MKKALIFLCVLVLMAAGGSAAFAGAIDNSTELTATYARFIAMATATDENAAIYNPAGTIFLKDGLYIYLSNLTAIDRYTQKPSDALVASGMEDEYKGETNSWIVPGFALTYKQDNWALFFTQAIVAGGGTADYADGSLTAVGGAVKLSAVPIGVLGAVPFSATAILTGVDTDICGSSAYYGFTLGGAYAINEMISVSVAGRYVLVTEDLEANGAIDILVTSALPSAATYNYGYKSETSANGWGGVIGLDITPMKGLLIGIKYETEVSIEKEIDSVDVKTSTVGNADYVLNGFGGADPTIEGLLDANLKTELGAEGDKEQRNLPATLILGASYMIMPELRVAADFGYFFQSQADWDGAEDNYDDAWTLALGFEYAVLPVLKASIGLAYIKIGADDKNYGLAESSYYDQYGFGIGAEYEVIPGLKIEFAYGHQFYMEIETADADTDGTKLGKDRNAFGIGVKYKIL